MPLRPPTAPFVIGILGPNPVGNDLRKIAAVKTIAGRRIKIENYQTPEEIRECHILFMPRGLDAELRRSAVKRLSGRGILFVGEDAGFLENGGVRGFRDSGKPYSDSHISVSL